MKFFIKSNLGNVIYDPVTGNVTNLTNHQCRNICGDLQSSSTRAIRNKEYSAIDFKPNCLTIYNSNKCNMSCSYCYANKTQESREIEIDSLAVKAAAKWVASNCIETGKPFVLGFHGGNEPLLNPELINSCISICKQITQRAGLELSTCCTTNGVVSENIAKWASQTFNFIRLSWDGPPEVHDRFRKTKNGSDTCNIIQENCKLLGNNHVKEANLSVRTTITRYSVKSLPDIVQYLNEYNIKNIDIYPVFNTTGFGNREYMNVNPNEFVKYYLLAKLWADKNNIKLTYPGSRSDNIHYRHCPIFQNNLTLTPDGYLTACFDCCHNLDKSNNQFMYGYYDIASKSLSIEWDKLDNLFETLSIEFEDCKECENNYHCARSCPTVCPVRGFNNSSINSDCTISRRINLAMIFIAAGYDLYYNLLKDSDEFFSSIEVFNCKSNG